MKYKFQNTKYEIRNTKYKIRNTKYIIQNKLIQNAKYRPTADNIHFEPSCNQQVYNKQKYKEEQWKSNGTVQPHH